MGKTNVTPETIDCTPTWAQIAPLLLDCIERGSNPQAIREARTALLQACTMADKLLKIKGELVEEVSDDV